MTTETPSRRNFLKLAAAAAAASPFSFALQAAEAKAKKKAFKISLAEWSLNKHMFKKDGYEPMDHLDFCKVARGLGIDEHVLRRTSIERRIRLIVLREYQSYQPDARRIQSDGSPTSRCTYVIRISCSRGC